MRRDKENMLKKKNDAKKKQKIEVDKAKAREEDEAKAKAEAKEKDVARKEKEPVEAVRVETELAKKATKEVVDKVVEEERQRKNIENREDDTHPMDLDIPGTSTTCTEEKEMIIGLGRGPLEHFRPAEVLDIKSFTYNSKNDRIVQERFKKVLVKEGDPISVVT